MTDPVFVPCDVCEYIREQRQHDSRESEFFLPIDDEGGTLGLCKEHHSDWRRVHFGCAMSGLEGGKQ